MTRANQQSREQILEQSILLRSASLLAWCLGGSDMNIMLVSVTERTKEIGIRKSLGARRRDILQQFLAESTALAVAGGAIGVAIAYALSKLVATLTPIPTALPLFAVAMALFVSGSIGLVAGVYPAWRAARLDPIVALRSSA